MARNSRRAEQGKTPIYRRKWFIILVVFLVLGGCVGNCTGSGTDNKGQEESTAQVEEAQETENNKAKQTEESVSSKEAEPKPVSTSEAAPAEAAPAIELIAGEENEYSESLTYNAGTEFEETLLAYNVPAGTYAVTNVGEYPTQVNVYEGVTTNDNGWEEPANVGDVITLKVGETSEITVPEGYHIEILEPTHVTLEMK